jgi:polyhydroxyalkanoate synthase
LDEVPLSGRLFRDILELLYRENRFCSGSLRIRGVSIGPSTLRSPMLTVVNAADEIAPAASVDPFLAALPKESILSLRHAGEIGVGLQHLAVLVGREAHARIWPKIIAWLRARA